MKIVFLDFDDIKNPLLGAGQARATLEVGKRLAAKGHQIMTISSKYPKSKDRFENGINYQHIGIGSANIRLNNLFYILFLPFAVRKLKADIIIECFTPPFSTLFSPLFTKIPVVALPTCFEAEEHSKHYHLPFYLIQNFGLRFYKYFLPYTKSDEERMRKHNKKIISKIVPEGVCDTFFQIKKTTPKHILCLGRFDINQKGIDLLLESFSLVANQIKYPLVLVGAGPDKNKVNNLIAKFKLTDKVILKEAAYGKEKEKLLSESAFVVMPSRFEGFSLFALETLATSLPIVCFDIPGFSWTDENICFKAKPFDTKEYANLLLEASNNRKATDEKGENARAYVKKYTWDNVAKDFETFFKKILNNYEQTK